jgi:hypothetical protein
MSPIPIAIDEAKIHALRLLRDFILNGSIYNTQRACSIADWSSGEDKAATCS